MSTQPMFRVTIWPLGAKPKSVPVLPGEITAPGSILFIGAGTDIDYFEVALDNSFTLLSGEQEARRRHADFVGGY